MVAEAVSLIGIIVFETNWSKSAQKNVSIFSNHPCFANKAIF